MEQSMNRPLSRLEAGEVAYIRQLRCSGLLRRRLVDLGFLPGAKVEVLPEASNRDPRVYLIKSTTLAIRNADAATVLVSSEPPETSQETGCLPQGISSPHRQETGTDDEAVSVALAGNPNAGKSTLFNALTGLNQHVGNWPGKTVSRAEGWWIHRGKKFRMIDLPGTYSLLSTSLEEEVARDYILFGSPTCTVIITDATRLERHLNLAIQILQITSRAVLCINMIDEAEREGIQIDREKIESELGIPVVLTAANRKKGLADLQEAIWQISIEGRPTNPVRIAMPEKITAAVEDLEGDLERVFPGLANTQWLAMRLIDGGDERIRYEVAQGLLADEEGRIGSRSLQGASPTQREIKR